MLYIYIKYLYDATYRYMWCPKFTAARTAPPGPSQKKIHSTLQLPKQPAHQVEIWNSYKQLSRSISW